MNRAYNWIRGGGYLFGLAGLGLFLAGRREGEWAPILLRAGGILLVLMFVCLILTYAIYLRALFLRRTRMYRKP